MRSSAAIASIPTVTRACFCRVKQAFTCGRLTSGGKADVSPAHHRTDGAGDRLRGRTGGGVQLCARHHRGPAGRALRPLLLDRHADRPRARPVAPELHELYYTLLLKDLGCSSNAARICELYETDDLRVQARLQDRRHSLAATLHFVLQPDRARQGRRWPSARRDRQHPQNGGAIAQEMIATRCTRGAEIARSCAFPSGVRRASTARRALGRRAGRPAARRGDSVATRGSRCWRRSWTCSTRMPGARGARRSAARARALVRSALVAAFERVARDDAFLDNLAIARRSSARLAHRAGRDGRPVDEDYLDDIAAAFGQVIDAKSPFTAGHSGRVAQYADMHRRAARGQPAAAAGCAARPSPRHRQARRVSNAILDKPGGARRDEWGTMREHAAHTAEILARIGAFVELADIAAAHHERLDGAGYPLRPRGADDPRETRIITVVRFLRRADRRPPVPRRAALRGARDHGSRGRPGNRRRMFRGAARKRSLAAGLGAFTRRRCWGSAVLPRQPRRR